jgi:FkbM family methyltransferase
MDRLFSKIVDHLRLKASYVWTPRDRLKLKQAWISTCQLVVAVNGDVGREIYYRGKYEPNETEFLKSALRENDICFDIGANIGYYTTLLATCARKGMVYAFEPDLFNFALLNVNVKINRLDNVILNQVAVGEESGESQFVVADDHAFSSLKNTARTEIQEIVDVPIITLDEYVRRNGIQRLNFLKIDVEGAEGSVIDGGKKCFENVLLRPRLMMLELVEQNQIAFGDKLENIVARLLQLDYEPFIIKDGKKAPFLEAHHNEYTNVFFSPKDNQRPANC